MRTTSYKELLLNSDALLNYNFKILHYNTVVSKNLRIFSCWCSLWTSPSSCWTNAPPSTRFRPSSKPNHTGDRVLQINHTEPVSWKALRSDFLNQFEIPWRSIIVCSLSPSATTGINLPPYSRSAVHDHRIRWEGSPTQITQVTGLQKSNHDFQKKTKYTGNRIF